MKAKRSKEEVEFTEFRNGQKRKKINKIKSLWTNF